MKLQLTLEQHGFELHGFTYTWIFFSKYLLLYYTICTWLNPRMHSHEYGGLTVELLADFQLLGGWAHLTPSLFKDQLYILSRILLKYTIVTKNVILLKNKYLMLFSQCLSIVYFQTYNKTLFKIYPLGTF